MTAYPKQTHRRPKQPAHVPKAVLADLTKRDGHRSAWTGADVDTLVPQHRQGGAGGRKGKHRLANLVWLESWINDQIESDADLQAEAVRRGIKVSVHERQVEMVPLEHAVHGRCLLDDDGGVHVGPEVF